MRYGIETLSPKFFGGAPDIAVTGPNVGSNLGVVVLASGTVGAATEAVKEGMYPLCLISHGRSQCSHTIFDRNPRYCFLRCLWLSDCMERSHAQLQHRIRPTRHPAHIRRTQCWPQALPAEQCLPQRQLPSFKQYVLLFCFGVPFCALQDLSCGTSIDAERRGDMREWRASANGKQRDEFEGMSY
jgi:hypothetical protein